ncbi:MAG: Uma2 family endonuclease [Anaerolineae bacterium]|nr:Uma2 family endonuclease [Anaerolineae bacterium]
MVAAVSPEVQERVREIVFLLMQRPITETIAMQVEAIEGFEHLEIVNGEWVGFEKDEYMAGEEHGRLEFKLLLSIGNHVEQHKLGMLYPGDTDFVLDGTPGDVRMARRPDIGFVRGQRVEKSKGYIYKAPDLAVEIISPSERPDAIQQKLNEYLDHGVEQVWQVYPETRQIVVNYADRTAKTYRVGDTIPGGDLLPGFALTVATIFEEA